MTMIGLHVKKASAVILTDTMSYTKNARSLGFVSKTMGLPHLDAAVATQGSGPFGSLAKVMFHSESNIYGGFDDMVEDAPAQLLHVWSQLVDAEERVTQDASAFLVGYSARDERFVAYRFDAENEFQAELITDGLALYPMPFAYRPSPIEAERMRVSFVSQFGATPEDANQIVDEWLAMEPLPPPEGIDGWRTLARAVRETRALQQFGRVIVGGKVIHTQIRLGSQTSTVIHRYDDEGPELIRLIEGTEHPRAIEGPCACGSGKTIVDCHATEYKAMMAENPRIPEPGVSDTLPT